MTEEPASGTEDVATLFSRRSSSFGREEGLRRFPHFGRRLVETADLSPGMRVLDVATGRLERKQAKGEGALKGSGKPKRGGSKAMSGTAVRGTARKKSASSTVAKTPRGRSTKSAKKR